MADFEYTGVLYLMGSHDTRKDEVQWNGSTDQALSGTVVDGTGVGAGVLSLDDEYSETHTFGVGSYTGWYVTISLPGGGSAHYGIFDTGVSPWGLSIPYDAATVPADFATLVGTSSVGAVLGNSASLSGAANCFSTGTRIATPRGERPIEALAPGDTVLTAWGARRRVV